LFVEWSNIGDEGRCKEYITNDYLKISIEINDRLGPSFLLSTKSIEKSRGK
jgi:hypothetical protein